MINEIPNLLTQEQIGALLTLFDAAPKSDGQVSAGAYVTSAKNNHEVAPSEEYDEMAKSVLEALQVNNTFARACWPVSSSMPIFSQYEQGMSYPMHFDNALTGYYANNNQIFPQQFRSDISATLFLSDPDSYTGGELLIQTPSGLNKIKAASGTLITYPSGYFHSVAEVTQGVRRSAVVWFQSYFKNAEQRNLIVEMNSAVTDLLARHPDDEAVKKTNYVLNHLLRMWGD